MANTPVDYPPHLFTLRLEFRAAVYGERRSDVIRWVNSKYTKSYTTARFYEYATERKPTPKLLIVEVIAKDFDEMVALVNV